jgi:diguanylate cyclase (GGDEF)-like protein
MSVTILTTIVSILAFFVFLAIFIPVLKNNKLFKGNKVILLASFSLVISNLFMTINWKTEYLNTTTFLYTLICFSAISLSFVLLTTLIVSLYSDLYKPNYYFIVLYTLCIGLFYGIASLLQWDYFLSNILYGVLLSVPVLITVSILRKKGINPFTNVFCYQFLILGLIYLSKMVNLYYLDTKSTFENQSVHDAMLNMFSVILIITMFTSYLIENQSIMIHKLKSNEFLLENSLRTVRTLSETDQLTGLSNRHKIEKDLELLLQNYKAYNASFTVLMCDIDNFKLINDTHGHSKGDDVIKFTADLLIRILRADDIVGRWGGDEFILLLPNTSESSIESILNKINRNFKERSVNSVIGFVSLSIGSATVTDYASTKDLLDLADTNMYFYKNNRK